MVHGCVTPHKEDTQHMEYCWCIPYFVTPADNDKFDWSRIIVYFGNVLRRHAQGNAYRRRK